MMKSREEIREICLYLLVGALTTGISIVTYALCAHWMQIGLIISNIISWLLAVSFAFVVNRVIVFKSEQTIWLQAIKFFVSRIIVLILETLMMYVLVENMKINDIGVKIFTQIIVIISNYILGKCMVFR